MGECSYLGRTGDNNYPTPPEAEELKKRALHKRQTVLGSWSSNIAMAEPNSISRTSWTEVEPRGSSIIAGM
jgi:hypothetical protein